ncbi:MAG: DEAD/DEAH box helicase family protein [Desulfosarcina sp.]|nr:DEAD/DEAH box helicase family protein [Desulfosarcina sp.]
MIKTLHLNRITFEINEHHDSYPQVPYVFKGILTNGQKSVLSALLNEPVGILQGAMGAGKKMLVLKLVAERKVSALVIVKTRHQLYQWKEMAKTFLNLSDRQIGFIGNGQKEIDKEFTLAIDRSLYPFVPDLENKVGFLIVDNCHHANLKQFTDAVANFKSPFMIGLSCVRRRLDGLDDVMKAYLGPVVAEVQVPKKPSSSIRPVYQVQRTGFDYFYQNDYGKMMAALCCDENRNEMIVKDILAETARFANQAVVVAERVEHLERIQKRLKSARKKKVAIITGQTPEKQKKQIQALFDERQVSVLLITQKSIPYLSVRSIKRLFIAAPLKFHGHLVQVVGNLLYGSDIVKGAIIYDYLDQPNVLKASLNSRLKSYRLMGVAARSF